MAGEADAPFEVLEGRIQAEISLLQGGDDLLQLRQGLDRKSVV